MVSLSLNPEIGTTDCTDYTDYKGLGSTVILTHYMVARMTAISIHELHENTGLWVRKATESEPIVVTDEGKAVAKIVPIPVVRETHPFRSRKLVPGYEAIMHKRYGGPDCTEIVSAMRDGK